MSSLLRRIGLALECYDSAEGAERCAAWVMEPTAALGSVVSHVVLSLARDRRLLASWLAEGVEASA